MGLARPKGVEMEVAPIPSETNSGAPQPRGEPPQTNAAQPGGSPKFDRNAYQREYMRGYRRRQAEKREAEK